MMKSPFIESLVEKENDDYLDFRLGAFEELAVQKDIALALFENTEKVSDENGKGLLDSAIRALAHEVHQLSYLKTEEDVLVKQHSVFGLRSYYEGVGLNLHNFKLISAAATYTLSMYLLEIYRGFLNNSDDPIGADADEIIELFKQSRRFYTNMLSAITKEEYEKLNATVTEQKAKRSNSGVATKAMNEKRLAEADADIRMLANAWWTKNSQIHLGHLVTEIDRYVSRNNAYGVKPRKGEDIAVVSKRHVKLVVEQVERELGLKTSRKKSAGELTLSYLEKNGEAPEEWLQYKRLVNSQRK